MIFLHPIFCVAHVAKIAFGSIWTRSSAGLGLSQQFGLPDYIPFNASEINAKYTFHIFYSSFVLSPITIYTNQIMKLI